MTYSTQQKRAQNRQLVLKACARLGPIRSIDIAAHVWGTGPSALRMAQSTITDLMQDRLLLMKKYGHTHLYALSAKGAALCGERYKSGKDLLRGLRRLDERHLANEFYLDIARHRHAIPPLTINRYAHFCRVGGRLPDVMTLYGHSFYDWVEVDCGHTSATEQERRCEFFLQHLRPGEHMNVSRLPTDPLYLAKFHLVFQHEDLFRPFLEVFKKQFHQRANHEPAPLYWAQAVLRRFQYHVRVSHSVFEERSLYLPS